VPPSPLPGEPATEPPQAQPPALVPAAVAFAGGDARSVAVGATDGSVRILDLADGKELSRLPAIPGAVRALDVSSDGRYAAVIGADALHVFATGDGRSVGTWPLPPGDWHVAFAPSAPALAAWAKGASVLLWHPGDEKPLPVNGLVPGPLAWADGATLVVAGGRSLHVWNVAASSAARRNALPDDATAVGASPDGRTFAAGFADGSVEILGTEGAVRARIEAQNGAVASVQFAGASVLATSADGEPVRLWNARTGEPLRRLAPPGDACCAATGVSSDGRLVLAASRDAVQVWDAPSGARFPARTLASRSPPAAAPRLSAEVKDIAAPGDGARPGRIVLSVKNAADAGEARDVGIAPARSVEGLLAVSPVPVERIAPGATAELALVVSSVPAAAQGPRDARLSLQPVYTGGKGPEVPVRLHVAAASIVADDATVDGARDEPVVRVQVRNAGDEASGPLRVDAMFRNGTSTPVAAQLRLPGLAAGERSVLAIPATPEAVSGGATLQLEIRAEGWPLPGWNIRVGLHRSTPWAVNIAGLGIALLLLALLALLRVNRHPVVVAVQRDASELRRFELSRLPDASRALSRARRLEAALTAARITREHWTRTLAATASPRAAAEAFASALGGRLGDALPGGDLWKLEMPELELRFPARTAVAVATGAAMEADAARILATASAGGAAPGTAAVALDLTAAQNAAEVLHATPAASFVVLSSAELRDLLLSDAPAAFQQIVARQRPLAELSPYRSSGGVEDENLFFGRERELRAIADRTLHNVILVAPRQMGKSSLLKAAERRLSARSDVQVSLLTLLEDDLPTRMARLLGKPRPTTVEEFIELASGARRKPRVWMIDEADTFILRDSREHYPLSLAMRTLSEEGRAYFVLAGFWHLHAAAVLNPNNPLRNFGEMLRLGPLDRDAARELATRPMTSLGIAWADAALADLVLDETGCRAHLVIAVCRSIVDGMGPSERVVTPAHVETALHRNPVLGDELKSWRREPLGRALVRASLPGAAPTRGELRDRIGAAGLHPPSDVFAAAVDKLELAYILVSDEQGRLSCPVPVLRRYVEHEDDPEAGLRRDAADYRGPVEARVKLKPAG